MTISVVQSIATPSGTQSVTFASNITVGNTVFIVVGEFDNSTTETVTNVKVGSTSVASKTLIFPQINVTDAQGFAVVMVPNIQVSGQKVVSYTYSGGSQIAAWGCEVAGLGANPVMNVSAANTGAVASMTSGTTPASTVASAFVLGGAATYNGSSSAPTGTTWSGGTDLGINSHLSVGWLIQTALGGTYAWNQAGGGTLGWASGVVVVSPGPALAQAIVVGQGNNDTDQPMAITTTAGNAYVVTFAAWQVGSTPFNVTAVSDTAGNTWNYATQSGTFDTTNGAYSISGIAWCLPSMQGTGNTTKAITAIQVDWSITVTDWGETIAMEIANLPSNATALATASTNTEVTAVTSYTMPSINPVTTPSGSNAVVVATSSTFGEFSAGPTGYTLLAGSDTVGGYNLNAATGSAIAPTFTLTASNNVPTAQTVAFGVGSTALTTSALLSVSPSFSATGHHGHGRSATLAETPTFVATKHHGHPRSGSLTPTPTFSATKHHGHPRGASLNPTPTFAAGRVRGRVRNAVKAITPAFVANRLHGHGRSATFNETPTFSATKHHGHPRSASLAPTPTFSAGRVRGRVRSAVKAITPTFVSTRIHGHGRSATLGVIPTWLATPVMHGGGIVRGALMAVTPSFVAHRIHGRTRSATSNQVPMLSAGRVRGKRRSAISNQVPDFFAGRSHGHKRGGTLDVVPTLLATAIVHGATIITLTASVTIACNSYTGLASDLTISATAGAPYQGNMRQLAQVRWNYMYPSE